MNNILTRIVLLIIFSFTILNSWTNAQWLDVSSNVSVNLKDVCFSDSSNGWAIGSNSTILHTNDGGFIWTMQTCPLVNQSLNKVFFLNKDFGVIAADKGLILRTRDGGIHWEESTFDTIVNFKDICFIDTSLGWVVGGSINKTGKNFGFILKTMDGGLNWSKQYETDTTLSYSEGNFTAIKVSDEKKGYAFTSSSGAQLYTTIDGGTNWYKKGSFFYGISNMDVFGDTIWVSGQGFASTVNQGQTWSYNSVLGGGVQDLVMLDGNNGFIISAWLNDKRLLSTKNGGLSWEDIWVYDGAVFLAMYINPLNNFICLVGSNGRIVINKSFLTAIVDSPRLTEMSMHLFQNFPNPFNPITNIKFRISAPGYYSLIVYSSIGEEVMRSINYYSRAGIYNIIFDGKSLSTGVYIFNLIGKNGSLSNKMLIQK